MPLSESPNAQAWREYNEAICAGPGCGKPKAKAQSFCKSCYYKLPVDMRQALYRRFGSGYQEAYDEAKEWLKNQ